jgi:hypothetical protein
MSALRSQSGPGNYDLKAVQHNWHRTASGILVPDGMVTDVSNRERTTYLKTKAKGDELERLYLENGIPVPANSDLADLLRNSRLLWENWFLNKIDQLEMIMLFKLLHLDRISEAALPLKTEAERKRYLRDLVSGNLDLFARVRSRTKDIFWELEVWSKLRRKMHGEIHLKEPPDIIVSFGSSKIGLACKKVYSERHVQNVLSEAVHQIEGAFDFGVVAVNLDDLVPADKLLRARTAKEMTETLQALNADFIQRHERHFRKYLSTGRLISALVSTTVIADIAAASPRFNTASQWTIWTIPGLDERKSGLLREFYELVVA